MPHSIEDQTSAEIFHLEQILASKTFEKSETLRALLRYLWKHRADRFSEYAIAIDALGRKRDFDSKVDATVRVQILRLRQRLSTFYETEGQSATSRFVIPLGTHQIHFLEVDGESNQESSDVCAPSLLSPAAVWVEHRRPAPSPILANGMLLWVLIMVLAGAALLVSTHGVRPAVVKKEPPAFWKQFLNNGKPAAVVLPIPVFFTWTTRSGSIFMARDISVNEFSQSKNSPEIADLENHMGQPELAQNYTVTSDTFASLRLVRFFDAYGVQAFISSAPESPEEMLDSENVIALGTSTSLTPFKTYVEELTFRLSTDQSIFDKTRDPANKPAFQAIHESGSRAILPGIIALLPGRSSDSRVLILQSRQTTGLISFLTSEEGLKQLDKARAAAGNAPFFEAVVLSEVDGVAALKNRLVAFRAYKPR